MNLTFYNSFVVIFFGAVSLFSLVSLVMAIKLMRARTVVEADGVKSATKAAQCGIKECAALFGQVIEDCRAISTSLCDMVESKKSEIQSCLAQVENEKATTLSLIEKARQTEESLNSALKASAKALWALDEAERYAEARRLIEAGVEPDEVSRLLEIPKCELALLLEINAS